MIKPIVSKPKDVKSDKTSEGENLKNMLEEAFGQFTGDQKINNNNLKTLADAFSGLAKTLSGVQFERYTKKFGPSATGRAIKKLSSLAAAAAKALTGKNVEAMRMALDAIANFSDALSKRSPSGRAALDGVTKVFATFRDVVNNIKEKLPFNLKETGAGENVANTLKLLLNKLPDNFAGLEDDAIWNALSAPGTGDMEAFVPFLKQVEKYNKKWHSYTAHVMNKLAALLRKLNVAVKGDKRGAVVKVLDELIKFCDKMHQSGDKLSIRGIYHVARGDSAIVSGAVRGQFEALRKRFRNLKKAISDLGVEKDQISRSLSIALYVPDDDNLANVYDVDRFVDYVRKCREVKQILKKKRSATKDVLVEFIRLLELYNRTLTRDRGNKGKAEAAKNLYNFCVKVGNNTVAARAGADATINSESVRRSFTEFADKLNKDLRTEEDDDNDGCSFREEWLKLVNA